MKNGIFFFFRMGNITRGARLAILPVAVLMMYLGVSSKLFPFLTVGEVFCVILGLIPAPPDRGMMRALERFYAETQTAAMEKAGVVNPECVTLLKGYREGKNDFLRRRVGNDYIYPNPVALAVIVRQNACVLTVGTRSLLNEKDAQIVSFSLSSRCPTRIVEEQTEDTVRVTLRLPESGEEMVFVATNDYHYRDFAEKLSSAGMGEFRTESPSKPS